MKNFFFLILLIFVSCLELSSNKSNIKLENNYQKVETKEGVSHNDPDSLDGDLEKEKQTLKHTPNWSNPFMGPFGIPIINVIRTYFLVGEFDMVKNFIVNSDCLDENEFKYLLRNSSWGYELDATNIKWQNDSTFLITAKSNINKTIGMEQYLGKVVNDTAKIFLFPQNKENPFVYDRKYPSADVQCQIKSLARTIDFDFNSSTLTAESKINLEMLKNLISNYPNLTLRVSGHTSSEGTDSYNLKLSVDRAKAVRSYLIKLGINKSKINYKGFGSSSPIYTDSNIGLRSRNRRVEVSILN